MMSDIFTRQAYFSWRVDAPWRSKRPYSKIAVLACNLKLWLTSLCAHHCGCLLFPQSGPPNQTAKATLFQGSNGRAAFTWGQTDVELETDVALTCVQGSCAVCLRIAPPLNSLLNPTTPLPQRWCGFELLWRSCICSHWKDGFHIKLSIL